MRSNIMMASVLALGFVFLASTTSMATPAKPKKPKKTTSGVTASNLDKTVKPTADFYQYVCKVQLEGIGLLQLVLTEL